MPEGCTALMGSSVHESSGFGFMEDAYFHHQDVQQKVQYLDPQLVFYASSPGTTILSGRDIGGSDYVKREGEALVLQARKGAEAEAYDETGKIECGLFGETRSSWNRGDEDREVVSLRGTELASGYETPPTLSLDPSPSSSSMASPAVSHSPDIKPNTPEPRSVLDLAISPRPSARSASSNYEFVDDSLGPDSVLLEVQVHEAFLNDFHGTDSGAHLLPLGEDSTQWQPPGSSGGCLSQQSGQLWMDSFIDDLAVNSAQTSLSGLETEAEEARTYSIDTPTSTPSVDHKSGSSDQEHSEEDANGDPTAGENSPTLRQAQSEPSRKNREGIPHQEVGLELVNLLLACAEAVSTKSLSLVNPLFAQLGELASPEGTSMQRVAAYFTEGLAARCSRLWPQIYQPLPYNLDLSEEENLSAFHILNHVCPYTKFSHFTANEIILQAFEGCDHVHVIDFDIKQGLQWPALFQSLAARPGGPPAHVRVTGVGDCKEDVQDTGDRLAEFAEALELEFEFHAVIDKLEDVRLWMLHVKDKEVVAVNCLFQLHRTLHDAANGIKDMLSLITSTKPKVVAVVEQEASHNGPFFEGRSPRFLESLQYYAAIFDSLDLNMPAESMARMKVEQFFAREIRNIIACEGPERVERHERIEKWCLHMNQGGFKSVPLSKRAKTQARLLLEMFACKSYTLTEDGGVLTLGWPSRPLFTASAWSPR